MESKEKNRRGIMGWLDPTIPNNIERWAYFFQRVTGLGILAYVIGHIGDTSFFVGGPFGTGPSQASWSFDLSVTENIIGHTILVLVVLIITFHGINGIRLILAELGIIIGKPSRIEYPYKPASLKSMQRHLLWVGIILAIFAAIWAGTILFG
jgi:succinate dehydrogenase / fumarate reductase cytochrome b subunit